jgi:hypothetical protein
MALEDGHMAVTVEQRAPRIRCHKCGSPQIAALCHHCWRPGCVKHVRPVTRWVKRLLGKEGSCTGLDNGQAYHCAECAEVPVGRTLAVGTAAGVMAAAGIFFAWLNLVAGLMLLLAGGLLAGSAWLALRRRAVEAVIAMPLPVQPKATDLSLLEKVSAKITLSPDGSYQTDPSAVEGVLTMVLVFGQADRERLDRRMGKRPRAPSRDVRFSAGRLVLKGHVGIRKDLEFPGPVLALDGRTGSYPVFRAENPHVSSSWHHAVHYQLSAEPDHSSGLVWITPSVVPESDQRALELEIQWIELGAEEKPLSLDVIELLQLRFPAEWGNVVQVSERAIQRTLPEDPGGSRMVEWRQLSATEHERQTGRLTLAARFERQINLKQRVQGRLVTTMKGTLSGVDGVSLYGSLGGRRNLSGASIRTRIEADFDLSLESIRYQAIRIVPDRTEDGAANAYPDEFRLIPDYETVIELTNALSKQEYYVKRVIENPPRSGGRASLVHRYWDIAGRRYEGVYPVDFHMVLTGEEVHRGDIRPEDGRTKIRITVKGAYLDDEMCEGVEKRWKELCALTADTLQRQEPAKRPATWHIPSGGAAPRPPAASWPVGPTGVAPPDPGLLRRLGKLDEALVDEKISPEQYREMRERAEREFGG